MSWCGRHFIGWLIAAVAITGLSAIILTTRLGTGDARATPAFPYTHSVAVKIAILDEWTRSPEPGCSVQGSGSISAALAWKGSPRARPEISRGAGRWVLLVPSSIGKAVLDLRAQPTTGSITYVDNSSDVGECEAPHDRSGCGRYPVGGNANVFGVDRRSLSVDSTVVFGSQLFKHHCLIGRYRGLNDREVFRFPLAVRMPPAQALASRHRVVVHASRVGRTHAEPLENALLTETVTETVDVVFTRLRH